MENNVVPIAGSVWTFEDYTERRCMLSDVGHERYDPGYAKRVAQRHTAAAIDALVDTMKQDDDLAAKVKAAQMLLDRGWGKAEQTVSVDGKSEVKVTISWASADRLSYQRGDVIEAEPVSPAAIAQDAQDAPWRDPLPDAETKVAVDALVREAKANGSPLG